VPRRPRNNLPDGYYHVTARAVSGSDLFVDDGDRREFVWLLGRFTAQFELRCFSYCLMSTHYHLLLAGTQVGLSAAMAAIHSRYAQRFNARHDRFGHLFAGRYSAYVVRDDEHLRQALDYVAFNRVKGGLCERPEEWRWTWVAQAKLDGIGGRIPLPVRQAASRQGTDPEGSVPAVRAAPG